MLEPTGSGTPRLPGPEFITQLAAELRRDGFSLAAWRRFFSRGWERSWAALRQEPARTRSVIGWAVFGAALGVAALLVAASVRPGAGWVLNGALWGLWYASTVALVLLLLDMLENEQGVPYKSMLLPNGLTFIRLSHAPLFISVLAAAGTSSMQGRLLCVYLGVVAGTDLIDGLLARALRKTSRLGSILDSFADMAVLVALATGLYLHGMISTLLLVLVWIRYAGTLLGGIIVGFWRGPLPLRHTLVGRATSFSSAFVLVAAAVLLLAAPSWLPRAWVNGGLQALTGLMMVNIVYFIYRAVRALTA